MTVPRDERRSNDIVVVKGGGDLGTGVILRLRHQGYRVVVTELPQPLVVRRAVAAASAVYEGQVTVEGMTARYVTDKAGIMAAWNEGHVPVIVDPAAHIVRDLEPLVVVDAIMAKRNTGTTLNDASIVIALGPGFHAGVDCHAVIETQRGPDLGRVYLRGSTSPDSGVPGDVGGEAARRVVRAPMSGTFTGLVQIGDRVSAGDVIAEVSGVPVTAQIAGVVRGLLAGGLMVRAGLKVGDVDPRDDPVVCFQVSDKAWQVANGVLEAVAILHRKQGVDG
jgi:xanthine dehydrogenase accessory factor